MPPSKSISDDPTAAAPRYQRIQRVLEERLAAGAYPLGSLMPTEIELASEFETSRFTVREALRHLTDRGYITRKQGMGTRVVSTDPKTEYVQSFDSLEELFQIAVETWFVFHETSKVVLDAELAGRVGGQAGEEWFKVTGVRWTQPGGRAICHVQSYIPARYADAVAALEDHEGPFFSLLERHADGPIDEVVQEIRAVAMPAEISRTLGLANGSWALQLLRRYRTAGGVLIASFNWHPADQLTYTMRIERLRGA
ncbi:MAG: GntR family transcriptional regulator [Roseibium sp.]|nr:GntR family transcriptional regulator [Roseibium sp.]